MQVRFERVKVSGFHINNASRWERRWREDARGVSFEDQMVSASRLLHGTRSGARQSKMTRAT